MQMMRRVEHLDAGDATVLPVNNHHRVHPVGRVAWDAFAARYQRLVGQVNVRRVDLGVVGDSHRGSLTPAEPCRSRAAPPIVHMRLVRI